MDKVDIITDLRKVDNLIHNCNLCSNVDKFSNDFSTVHIGKNTDIVIIGEAPSKNGWRNSGIAFRDTNGKLIPSGEILQKLLSNIGLDLKDIYFIEAVKCYPKNNVYDCIENCRQFLYSQLNIIKPKIILTMGVNATRTVGIMFNRLKEVVGKQFKFNQYSIIIPIYHTSPISPIGYTGNIEIFNEVKTLLNS